MDTPTRMLIRAYNWREVNNGNLKATCSISIDNKIKLHQCRVIQQPNQLAWPSLPQASWTDPEGRIRYFPLVELPKSVEHEVKKCILRGWEEFEYAPA